MDAQILKKQVRLSHRTLISLSLILILAGVIGKLFEKMLDFSQNFLVFGGIALLLKSLSLAALPILLFLLSKELERIKSKRRAGAIHFLFAVFSEVLYNLIGAGRLIDAATKGPAFAFRLCFIIGGLRERGNRFLNIAITLAAFFWSAALSIEEGIPCILIFSSCFFLRKKETLRLFCMALTLGIVSLANPLYILSLPVPALLHFYNE